MAAALGREIGAGAEGAVAMTGKDHGADAVVGIGDIDRLDDLGHHHPCEGVHLLGTIQRQRGDALRDLQLDLCVFGHLGPLPSSGPIRRPI